MSFSGEVKEELVKLAVDARHCQIAELAAILVCSGAVRTDASGVNTIEFQSDTLFAAERCQLLFERLFCVQQTISQNPVPEPQSKKMPHGDKENDSIIATNPVQDRLCQNMLYLGPDSSGVVHKALQMIKYKDGDRLVNPLVIKSLCCKRAYLRGAFLSIGSMSNPEKGYHLEFVCTDAQQAEQLVDTLTFYEIHAKIVTRKKYQVVYIKESEEIVELLNVMGAHISLMKLENLRILKDMRNSINRKVNCEAANISKTVNAATRQIDDILYIQAHYGFDNLADSLKQIAQLRLDYPDATLKELGEYLTPRMGKSGVNHRLRKLSELAQKLRET